MLHILGMVGKGIGIALLCILILLIVLLFVVLFVPIRYRMIGEKEAEGMPEGAARLTWLFHSVACFAVWKGKLHLGVRIFGIPVYDNFKKAGKSKKRRRPEPEPRRAERMPVRESGPEPAGPPAYEEEPEEIPEERQDREPYREKKPPVGIRIWESFRNLVRKIAAFFRMLLRLAEKIAGLPRSLCEKAVHLKEKIQDFMAFLQRDDLKRAFVLCKKQLLRVWRNVRPRTVKADIRFGFEDPSVTGQILAAAGMLYPIMGKNMVLRPDFEEPVLSGEIRIRGRITVFVLLRVLWNLYFDKDIKRLVRIWKKEETLHGRQ